MVKESIPIDTKATASFLESIGDKWSITVLAILCQTGPRRFGNIRNAIGTISQRSLSLCLRDLERSGLVSRQVLEREIPVGVEYSITELGYTLQAPIVALNEWALKHGAAVSAAQRAYDRGESLSYSVSPP